MLTYADSICYSFVSTARHLVDNKKKIVINVCLLQSFQLESHKICITKRLF